jgi:asparagine synthase (glutamine-hydrolysing)
MADTLNVYNIGYQEANEYGYAASLSRMKGFDYYQVAMGFEDMAGILDDVLATMDQPLSDAACFPTLHLSRIVKRRLTVMLSGEGADELFSGYWQYQGIMDSRSPTDTGREAMLDHMRRSSYYLDQMGVIEPGYAVKYNPLTAAEAAWSNGNDPRLLQRVTRFDIDTWLADDLLMKVDKMSMGASIEARVPFLDRYLMEYVLGLPDEYKYSNGTTKRILKDVAEELGVPSDITRRPKMGFTVPIHSLLQGPFKARFLDTLPAVKALPYIRGRVVDQIVRDYYAGRSELSLFCWVLFVFAAWYDKETRGA